MNRRSLPWVIAVPLMIGGSLSAHSLGSLWPAHAPRALAADPDMRSEVVARSSHGLSTLLPLSAGVIVALTVIGFFCYLWRCRREEGMRGIAPVWFFLLPPLAFIVQEVVERLVHAESVPFNPAHEPALLAALVLQIPFGVVAYLVARVLLRVADVLGRALFRRRRAFPVARASTPRPSRPLLRRRTLALLEGHSSRSPPLVAT